MLDQGKGSNWDLFANQYKYSQEACHLWQWKNQLRIRHWNFYNESMGIYDFSIVRDGKKVLPWSVACLWKILNFSIKWSCLPKWFLPYVVLPSIVLLIFDEDLNRNFSTRLVWEQFRQMWTLPDFFITFCRTFCDKFLSYRARLFVTNNLWPF